MDIREHIRSGFENSIRDAVSGNEELMNDPLFGGMLVRSAISNFYMSMVDNTMLYLLADENGLDYDAILDEERDRVITKYFR